MWLTDALLKGMKLAQKLSGDNVDVSVVLTGKPIVILVDISISNNIIPSCPTSAHGSITSSYVNRPSAVSWMDGY